MGRRGVLAGLIGVALVVPLALAGGLLLLPMTPEDFHVPGSQSGDLEANRFLSPTSCSFCHGNFAEETEPYTAWRGSLMAQAGRDPLYLAQVATARQDVPQVGSYCSRCHVPLSVVTGSVDDPTGESLTTQDLDGVSCHFCHTMVDPIYKPGISPPEDEAILAALEDVPSFYGNAMFVLDPTATRRGPRPTEFAPHQMIESAFHKSGSFCGSCHDVGNLAVSKQPNGTYRYNTIGEESPSDDPHAQFPLERTYTEWKLSAFADGGVDMGGRFGGYNVTTVSTCQDCHMPRVQGASCFFGPEYDDLPRHDFAGAADWVLEIIAEHYGPLNDPGVDVDAIAVGRERARSMLQRAASLELDQHGGVLQARVINETGHKLPTGHIEGRRVWVNVQALDDQDELVREWGHYDPIEAHLDEESTTVYEMHVGLSDEAAAATGFAAGVTTHMALADTIVKDNRIPPRGYDRAAYAAAGAPVVGADYADGQHWDDTWFEIPPGATKIRVTVYYAVVTRHYIETLRDANVTDDWGDILHDLWERTNRAPPTEITTSEIELEPYLRGDVNGDDIVNALDLATVLGYWGASPGPNDLNADGFVDILDLTAVLSQYGQSR